MSRLQLTEEQVQAHQAKVAGWRRPAAPVTVRVPAEPAPKPFKYRNKPTEIDSLTFASKREARRYVELKNMQQAGQITGLRMQVEIPCIVNGREVCTYVADFHYVDHSSPDPMDQAEVYEDAKGARTDVYKLKRKLVAACTGIEIVEV